MNGKLHPLIAAPAAVLLLTTAHGAAPAHKSKLVCRLIPTAVIKAVQGSPVVDKKSSGATVGGFHMRGCYYRLAKANESLSLVVTRASGAGQSSRLHRRWKRLFHTTGQGTENPDAADKDDAAQEPADEEEKEKAAVKKPQKVAGLGREAFWVGKGPVDALYVLADNAYLRLSIGGAAAHAQKVAKAKRLLRTALKRLP